MAFKMKGSAFKLGNVATKSALKHTQLKSPLEQRQTVEEGRALPFDPDASYIPPHIQERWPGSNPVTGMSETWEETPKEGRGIKYRGEGGRYHVYDPTKWEGHKKLMPGGEPVDMSKSMWDIKTQSWVPLQEFELETPEEGAADITDLPPEEGQPFEGEAKQVEKKLPWWRRRRTNVDDRQEPLGD